MFRPVRTAISVAVLVGALWAAFAVELGDKTFAEHVDTISETPEAKQLLEGTRATINPALVEIRDRVLGEYVEAPTWIPDQEPQTGAPQPASAPSIEPRTSPDRPAEPPLPGRRRAAPAEAPEPPLPGRR
ncbi:MAG: hypothetical protein R6X02_31395 [Enhygromyxa sp.]